MPLKMTFPRSAMTQHTKVESDFIYCAQLIRGHLSGRLMPKGMPIDGGHAATWRQHLMWQLRTPIEGVSVETEEIVQQAWMAATTMHVELHGKAVDDMYEVYNRQSIKMVEVLVSSFIESDEDLLAFKLKSTSPPKFVHSMESILPWASWTSCGINDFPADIRIVGSGLEMRWKDSDGRLHRDIDNGPALVRVSVEDGIVNVQHFLEGARTRGHEKWAKKCAKSNPWLQYTTIVE
jgi:hypothetical protein